MHWAGGEASATFNLVEAIKSRPTSGGAALKLPFYLSTKGTKIKPGYSFNSKSFSDFLIISHKL